MNLKFGKIGLGTHPFSNVFGRINETEVKKIVYKYLDLGGKYIHTAPYYKGVDPILKKVLKEVPRNSYYLGTLCLKDRQGLKSGKYDAIIEQCEDSLMELGVDHLDLLMPSSARGSDAPYAETMGALVDLKKQGKIRSIGVCNVNLEQLKEFNKNGDVSFVQNRFSFIDRSFSQEFIDYCEANQIFFIPYNVIEWGLLTNKILKGINLKNDDFRKKLSIMFNEEPLSVLTDWALNYLKPIANKYQTSIEAMAICWVMNQKQVSTPVIGATKTEQLVSSMQALNLEHPSEIINQLERVYSILVETVQRQKGLQLNQFIRNSYELWGTGATKH
ncbi:MAG: aldo/keto reductase [Bacteroidetes bacterium]|nr:MAG: aldo/keto reductase [Bacteroidota bacterium]